MRTRSTASILTAILSISALGLLGQSQSQSKDRFMIKADQVAQALSERGGHVGPQQVSLLANMSASEPYPLLDVLAVKPLGEQPTGERVGTHSLVELACHIPGACLPFYATVVWPQGQPAVELRTTGSAASSEDAMLGASHEITMRAGTHATLVMDDHRSHIQVSVISLENGIVGRRIRVVSPDRKQFYTGEVVSAGLLKRSY